MNNKIYQKQVSLLLKILPEIAKETCFALHGGTAINLFIRDMPRLSVDIDLTYIPIEDRKKSLQKINEALSRIKRQVEIMLLDARVQHKKDIAKLIISLQGIQIKVEVNLISRGVLGHPSKMFLCERAQIEYDAFVGIQVVSLGQLYGGKICAALDRQHPRDLFDIKYLLDHEGISEEVKAGFLLCLIGSDRPIHEIIAPHLLDQRTAMSNQFAGMSSEKFTYDEYEKTRDRLIFTINQALTSKDKLFLLSIKKLNPNWDLYDFQRFPMVKWKIQNLKKLKILHPKKYQNQCDLLKYQLFHSDFAAKNPMPILIEILTKKKGNELVQLTKEALEMGVDINDSFNGHRPLQCLIRATLDPRKKFELMKRFVNLGADVHSSDTSGTPYQISISKKNKRISDFLRSNGGYEESFFQEMEE